MWPFFAAIFRSLGESFCNKIFLPNIDWSLGEVLRLIISILLENLHWAWWMIYEVRLMSVITLFTSTLQVNTNLMMMNALQVDSWKPIEQAAASSSQQQSALTINNSSLSRVWTWNNIYRPGIRSDCKLEQDRKLFYFWFQLQLRSNFSKYTQWVSWAAIT